jgi:predicted PurR-regulated permease PerM
VGVDTALWTGVAYIAASQIEANLIYPVIQKRAVSLPPALTLFAILATGLLLGPLGVLFAVPLVVIAAILVVRLYVRRVLGEDATIPGR